MSHARPIAHSKSYSTGLAVAHVPPDIRYRKAWFLAPVFLVVVLTSGYWLADERGLLAPGAHPFFFFLNLVVACPLASVLLWSIFGQHWYRCKWIDLNKLPEAPWVAPLGDSEMGVSTPAGTGASRFIMPPLAEVKNEPGTLRLLCRHEQDGPALMKSCVMIVQLLCAVPIWASIHYATLYYVVAILVFPVFFIVIITLALIYALVSGPSPWSFIEVSMDHAKWLVPQSSSMKVDLKAFDIVDMSAVAGGLKLTVRRSGSETTENFVVALPEGSLPVKAQADMALWAFQRQKRGAEEKEAEQ